MKSQTQPVENENVMEDFYGMTEVDEVEIKVVYEKFDDPHGINQYKRKIYINGRWLLIHLSLYKDVFDEDNDEWLNGFCRSLDLFGKDYKIVSDTSKYDPLETIEDE